MKREGSTRATMGVATAAKEGSVSRTPPAANSSATAASVTFRRPTSPCFFILRRGRGGGGTRALQQLPLQH